MGKIIVLDENTSNKIAAGEVIERPASVIKELVENSIDAGASSISIEIKNGGIQYIKVSDNGSGIDEDDAELAFERHATSKIKSSKDLESISTLGFRGEALASIAAVSTMELTTRSGSNSQGTHIIIQNGNIKDIRQTGCPVGTTFIVTGLFYNTPARFKFLKKDNTEAGYISDIVSRLALANPNISFKLISNGKIITHTPGNNDLLSSIFSIYGKDTSRDVIEINYSDDRLIASGYTGKPETARSSRLGQSIFINGRYIKSKLITSAIDEAYKTLLMKGKFAFVIINIKLNPLMTDVNVHPTKMEIRFSDEQEIFRSIYHAISNALAEKSLIRDVHVSEKKEDDSVSSNMAIMEYTQDKIKSNYNAVKEATSYDTKEKSKIPNEIVETDVNTITNTNANEYLITDTGIASSFFKEVRIIGQAFSTYILLQGENDMYIIDQHAAHERILFESLKKRYLNNESMSQDLLPPMVIELTNQEIKLLEEQKVFFESIGFIYENFGNNSIILRSAPYNDFNIKQAFLEVVDHINDSSKVDYKSMVEETLYSIACKAAIKANKKLDEKEIISIIQKMTEIENPFTCPHGRPTIIKFTKHELEKMFKRIV